MQTEEFLNRAETILKQPAAQVLISRLEKLIETFSRNTDLRGITIKLKEFERKIKQ
ncbi:MAG: hypothetical protein M3Q99_18090 [Acidobacteriota bacterium]|nr:hypothetical protein [Acidobacteriota bacterium]